MPDNQKSSREIVSETVRSLLLELTYNDPDLDDPGANLGAVYQRKVREMAAYMHVSPAYLPGKIKKHYWNLDDLDKIAAFFDLEPADFLRGLKRSQPKEIEDDE